MLFWGNFSSSQSYSLFELLRFTFERHNFFPVRKYESAQSFNSEAVSFVGHVLAHYCIFLCSAWLWLVKEAMLLFFIIDDFKTLKYMSLAFDEGFFMVSQHYTMYAEESFIIFFPQKMLTGFNFI